MMHIFSKSKVVVAALLLLSLATINHSFAAQPKEEDQEKQKMIKPSKKLLPVLGAKGHLHFTNQLSIRIHNPQSNPRQPDKLLSTVDNKLNCSPSQKNNKLRIVIGIYIGIGLAGSAIGIRDNELLSSTIGLGIVITGLNNEIILTNLTKSKFLLSLGLLYVALCLNLYFTYL